MNVKIAILGLGEAGSHFANDLAEMGVSVIGYDPNPVQKLHQNVLLAASNAEAVKDADIIFSANLSSESESIAHEILPNLNQHQFFCEMNTSSPEKKKNIDGILKTSGVKMIDLAIMAPVPPKGIKTPFLASGKFAGEFLEQVKPLNFDISMVENGKIGDAATQKLLRSIVYKGIAAVVCEAMEAGQAFGMEQYMRNQIASLIGGNNDLIDRFVEGSRTHAVRRMHEMEAVIEMLHEKNIDPIVTTGTRNNLEKLSFEKKKLILNSQFLIPYFQFRGGSSKGLFFNAKDLPSDEKERNELIIKIMEGSLLGDPRQIDGLGGANSLTSKVAIVSLSNNPAYDLDYYFIQVVVGKGKVSTTQTCGNILAGVLPFAIESGMIDAQEGTTSAKINIVNTGGICEVVVETPNKQVNYAGNTKIDGVVGTAAPIICNYLDTVGATCGALLPTGNTIDLIDGIETTCIDNGMPLVIMQANAFGLTGNESKEVLEANEDLKKRIEKIRLQAGYLMNLGDVSEQTIPKMCLVSPPQNGGVINTRMFIPHVVHEAIGVLAAVSVATAYLVMRYELGDMRYKSGENSSLISHTSYLSIEHPSGEFTVSLEYSPEASVALTPEGGMKEENNSKEIRNPKSEICITKSGVIRTARLLSRGEVFIPV